MLGVTNLVLVSRLQLPIRRTKSAIARNYTWAGIYNTHFWVDPKREIAAVLMIQVLPFYDDSVIKLYHDFEEAIGKNMR